MRVIATATLDAFAGAAADMVCDQVRGKANSVFALPTGNTPIALYAELARRTRVGLMTFTSTRVFNLDEYCGLSAADPHSYAAFLRSHVVEPWGLPLSQARLLRGDAADLAGECRAYDTAIDVAGGIDMCILGLGVNGHVAFNEPGSAWDTTTHVVNLAHATRAAHERQAADSWQIPDKGITMGIKTLREAGQILLLIAGSGKQAARAALDRAVADAAWPVTSLLGHPRLTILELSGVVEHR